MNIWDRRLRAVLGLGVLSLVFVGPQTALGYLGLIAVLSAASGYCPLQSFLKKRKESLVSQQVIEKDCWDREQRKSV